MPTNPSPTANLPCEQCGYLNEPERVYCHNCGAKLDRSLLPRSDEKKQESPERARKRITRMTNPNTGWFWREVKMLFKMTIYAALVAVIILIAQAPDGVPQGKKDPAMRLVSSDLMDALQSPSPARVTFTEDEANQFLKQKLKAKEGTVPGVTFVRAFVNMRPGVLRISAENSVWGYPAFSGMEYRLEVKEGKFVTTVVGGNFGRLAVDPQIMRHAGAMFGSLWTSLATERKNMDKMQSVTVGDKQIELITKGAAAAR